MMIDQTFVGSLLWVQGLERSNLRVKTEEERPVEFAATFAALQPNTPLLARPLYLYRLQNSLTVEQMAHWLGLIEADDFYRLAVCLAPQPAVASMGWKDYIAILSRYFPSLKLNRLQLVVRTSNSLKLVTTIVS
jgi:hypothetical protein